MTQELIERLEPCPYVLGSVSKSDDFSEDDGPLWEAEVQTNGGYGVAATIYADTEDAARQMAEQAIAAWNPRTAPDDVLLASVKESLEDVFYDTLNCGFDSDLLARAAIEACDQSQSARIAELREAMKPFAIYADIQDDHRRSDDEGFCSTTVHGSTGKTTRITCGDLRRLRDALTKDSTSG